MVQLTVRKQRYKFGMFKRLHYILISTVVVILIFFLISSLSFSDRLAEGGLSSMNYLCIPVNIELCRLRSKNMEDPLVAPRRLSRFTLLRRLLEHRVPLAAVGTQPTPRYVRRNLAGR